MPFVKLNGRELFYTRRSSTAQPKSSNIAILMIHGLGSSNSFYAPINPVLAAEGLDCIALDTCGMRYYPQLRVGV
jgi:pimeloyl-ACP methyl ester carboxylesterase